MKVRVLFFSLLQDIVGESEMEVRLDMETAKVADLLDSLFENFPPLRDWDAKLLIAVDCEYADRETPVSDGQEIAMMPPVQGG